MTVAISSLGAFACVWAVICLVSGALVTDAMLKLAGLTSEGL